MSDSRISIIAAIGAETRALGDSRANDLLWHIPEDLKRFKELTLSHPVIMGRKTWESLPEKARPLPGRTNIVVTRQKDYRASGAEVCTSIKEALDKARAVLSSNVAGGNIAGGPEIFVIGGGEIYKQSLPYVNRLYLTLVEDDKVGDVIFPEYKNDFTNVVEKESCESNGLRYTWLTLDRV